jgi:hypothetical protein
MLGTVAENRANLRLRLPRFLLDEEARVAGVTGSETDEHGELVDAEELVGAKVRVATSRPTSGRDGWLTAVEVEEPTEGALKYVWFAEESLERVGPDPTPEEWGESIWLDNVRLELVTNLVSGDPEAYEQGVTPDTEPDRQGNSIAERAEAVLRTLVACEQFLWGIGPGEHDRLEILIRLEPTSDVLAAYEQIVSVPPRAWMHGEDLRGFPMSYWVRPLSEDNVQFLVPGIVHAKVTCEHWSTPERLVALTGPRRL